MTVTTAPTDRFMVFPAVIAVILIALFSTTGYAAFNFEKYEVSNLFILVVSFALFISYSVLLVVRLLQRRWRTSASIAVALILLISSFLMLFEIELQIDRLRFYVFRDRYVREATSGPDQTSGRQFKALRWGANAGVYRLLIYDKTDALLSAPLSAEMREAIKEKIPTSLSPCNISARQLEGHFYLVQVGCP
jgi:hypothetical protein